MVISFCVVATFLLIVLAKSSATATAQKPNKILELVLLPGINQRLTKSEYVVKNTSLLIVCTQAENWFSSSPTLTADGVDVVKNNTATFGQVKANSSTVALFIAAFHGGQHAMVVECSSLAKNKKHITKRIRLHEKLKDSPPDGSKLCDPGNPWKLMCRNGGRCLTDIKTHASHCQCTEPWRGLYCGEGGPALHSRVEAD